MFLHNLSEGTVVEAPKSGICETNAWKFSVVTDSVVESMCSITIRYFFGGLHHTPLCSLMG